MACSVPCPCDIIPWEQPQGRAGPVPLLKLQMVPTLKILISYGSKKGNQIYYPFFSQKDLASESPPGTQMGPLGRERERDTHIQGIFTSLLIYLLLSFPQSPMFSNMVTMDADTNGQARGFYSFIHVCLQESPKSRPPTYRQNIRSPSMETEGLHTMGCGLVPQPHC